MKKPVILPVIIVAVLLCSFRYTGSWTKYTSTEGHYSIEFPGKPTESAEEDTSNMSAPLTIHYAIYFPKDTEGYMADWINLANMYPAKKPIKQILQDSRDGALRTIKPTYVNTSAIYLGKNPYIEFSFTSKELAGKGRIYVINKFQYSVITIFSLSAGISPDADRFIQSFKHIP